MVLLHLSHIIISAVMVSSWIHSRTMPYQSPTRKRIDKAFLVYPRFTSFHSSSLIPNDEHKVEDSSVISESGRENERSTGTTILWFRASKKFVSNPIPYPFQSNMTMTSEFLDKFFSMDDTYTILLAGSDSIVTKQPKENIPSMKDVWEKECRKLGAEVPSSISLSSDECLLFQVQTSGMNFPGLKVFSLITIGSMKHKPSLRTGSFPEIQFVLLQTENKAQGLLQGIYNALMGISSNKKGSTSESMNNNTNMQHSFTKVSVEPSIDGSQFVFTSNVMIEIGVQFPSFLLKILPVNKEKAEEQGSLAVSRFIDKDVQQSLNRLSELYSKVIQPFQG